MAEPLLRLQGVCKDFGSLVVTDDVTLDVHAGEMHALIGPNGAGKTTLINQMSGLIAPDAGTVVFAGDDITALPPQTRALRGMSRTFQISSILPGFAVLENVALAVQARTGSSFRFFGNAAAEPALNIPAMAALEATGIAHRANARAGELSHGEKRALELAIALAMQPRLLLLDEPMAGMNREEKEDMSRFIVEANRYRGATIALIEHDIGVVMDLSDRVVVLDYGRKIADDVPEKVKSDGKVIGAYLGVSR